MGLIHPEIAMSVADKGPDLSKAMRNALGAYNIARGMKEDRRKGEVRNALAEAGGEVTPEVVAKVMTIDPEQGVSLEQMRERQQVFNHQLFESDMGLIKLVGGVHRNLNGVYAKELAKHGDPIKAGMKANEAWQAALPMLRRRMGNGTAERVFNKPVDELLEGTYDPHQFGQAEQALFGMEQQQRELWNILTRKPDGKTSSTTVYASQEEAAQQAAEAGGVLEKPGTSAPQTAQTEQKPTPQTDIGKLFADYKEGMLGKTPEENEANLQTKLAQLNFDGLDPAKAREFAGKLGDDYYTASKNFLTVQEQFGMIRAVAGQEPSAANDMALIFGIMKMYDPGSVVRESEYATARNAAGVPEWVRTQYNRMLAGEQLGPEQRTQFVTTAQTVYQSKLQLQNIVKQNFADMAERGQLDPADVLQRVAMDPAFEKPVATGKGRETRTGQALTVAKQTPKGGGPSREEVKPGERYMAPDGTWRIKQ